MGNHKVIIGDTTFAEIDNQNNLLLNIKKLMVHAVTKNGTDADSDIHYVTRPAPAAFGTARDNSELTKVYLYKPGQGALPTRVTSAGDTHPYDRPVGHSETHHEWPLMKVAAQVSYYHFPTGPTGPTAATVPAETRMNIADVIAKINSELEIPDDKKLAITDDYLRSGNHYLYACSKTPEAQCASNDWPLLQIKRESSFFTLTNILIMIAILIVIIIIIMMLTKKKGVNYNYDNYYFDDDMYLEDYM